MTRRRWLPATEERILRPALEALDPDVRQAVETDLDRLLDDPDDPGFAWADWRGRPDTTHPWKSRVALIAGGRAAIRYVVFRDQPYILVISLVQAPKPGG